MTQRAIHSNADRRSGIYVVFYYVQTYPRVVGNDPPRLPAITIPLAQLNGAREKSSRAASSCKSAGTFRAWPSGQYGWGTMSSMT